MKYKKIILILILIAITFIPCFDAHARTLPWFTILTHNYSNGEKITADENSEVAVGETLQLYGMMVYASTTIDGLTVIDSGTYVSDNNLSGITWSSNNEGIATVDNTGKVTGVAAGETKITAIYDGSSKDYEIKVIPKKEIRFFYTTPEPAKIINKEYDFRIGLYNIPDSEKENISVTINNENIAKITVIDLCDSGDGSVNGMIIANVKFLSLGRTTITATLNYNGKTYSDSYDFEVIESAYTLSLSAKELASLPASIAMGKQIQLAATLNIYGGSLIPEDVTNKGVTWESSDEKIATVDNKGLVTAISKGSVTITAKYKVNDEIITTTYNLRITDSNNSSQIVKVPNTSAEKTEYFYALGILMVIIGGGLITYKSLKV